MRKLIYAIGIFLFFVLFVVFSSNVLINTITGLNADLEKNNETEKVLSGKLSSLQAVSSQAAADSQITLNALPSTNPLLVVLSTVRTQAQSLGLNVAGISSGGIVDVEGGKTIKNIRKIASIKAVLEKKSVGINVAEL